MVSGLVSAFLAASFLRHSATSARSTSLQETPQEFGVQPAERPREGSAAFVRRETVVNSEGVSSDYGDGRFGG